MGFKWVNHGRRGAIRCWSDDERDLNKIIIWLITKLKRVTKDQTKEIEFDDRWSDRRCDKTRIAGSTTNKLRSPSPFSKLKKNQIIINFKSDSRKITMIAELRLAETKGKWFFQKNKSIQFFFFFFNTNFGVKIINYKINFYPLKPIFNVQNIIYAVIIN